MHIVISKPWDDKDIQDVYIVEHDNPKKDFETDWDEVKKTVKEKNPETWMVEQVIVGMKRRGWSILHVSPIQVEY